MSRTQTLAIDSARAKAGPTANLARYFYTGASVLMVLLVLVGFNKFYFHGRAYPDRALTPPIKTLVIAHGAAMSGWILLMLVQPLLILRGNRRLHMTMGRLGALFAGVILILGIWLGVRSAAVTPPEARIWGMAPQQFMAIPFISAWVFAIFVALGVYYRRRPHIHKPMMLLATLSAMSAAVSRIDPLNNLYLGTIWEHLFGPFFMTLVLSVALLFVRSALQRSLDRVFTLGLGMLIAISALIMQIAATDAWGRFASMLVN